MSLYQRVMAGRESRILPPPERDMPLPELYIGWWEYPATRGFGDPYGPDPVVFGDVPRVKL